jgi:hypothetical protein
VDGQAPGDIADPSLAVSGLISSVASEIDESQEIWNQSQFDDSAAPGEFERSLRRQFDPDLRQQKNILVAAGVAQQIAAAETDASVTVPALTAADYADAAAIDRLRDDRAALEAQLAECRAEVSALEDELSADPNEALTPAREAELRRDADFGAKLDELKRAVEVERERLSKQPPPRASLDSRQRAFHEKAQKLPVRAAVGGALAQRRFDDQLQTARVLFDHGFALTSVVTRASARFPDPPFTRQSQRFIARERFDEMGNWIVQQMRGLILDIGALSDRFPPA